MKVLSATWRTGGCATLVHPTGQSGETQKLSKVRKQESQTRERERINHYLFLSVIQKKKKKYLTTHPAYKLKLNIFVSSLKLARKNNLRNSFHCGSVKRNFRVLLGERCHSAVQGQL